ncbi:MAG: zinc metallopeptidase [Atopobiaceae bacterium]|nr:zinc metallopeptidase [Atopobiaceae bacterium]
MNYGYGYGYGYGSDMSYIILCVVTFVIGLAAQAYINSTYNKWSKVPASGGRSGAEMARSMLQVFGANSVGIGKVRGHLTDNYNPATNVLSLSEENFSGGSVASVAVACHEAGHAVQTAKGYLPGKIRTAIVPVVSISQSIWGLAFMAGIMMNAIGLVRFAIILFAFSVIFQLVTLPVEIDASRRAIEYLGEYGSAQDMQGARQVLTAAALTYVAAAMTSVLQLLYLVGQTNRRSR